VVQAFGGSSEEAAEQQKKLVAIMTVLQGLQAIQAELTNKDSIFRKVANFLTSQQTKLTQAQATAQATANTVTDAGTKSVNRFGVALKGIGIGLLLSLIPLLVSAFSSAADATEDWKDKQKALNDVNEKALDGYLQQELEIRSLVAQIKNENTTNDQKKEILKEVNEKYSSQIGHLDNINELETKFVANSENIIGALRLRAKAQAALALATEASKKEMEAQLELDKVKKAISEAGDNGIYQRLQEGIDQKGKKAIEAAKKDKETYLSILTELNTQASKTAVKPAAIDPNAKLSSTQLDSLISQTNEKIKSLKEGDPLIKKYEAERKNYQTRLDAIEGKKVDKSIGDQNKFSDEKRKAEAAARQQSLQDDIAAIQDVIDNEKNSFQVRFQATQEFYNKKLELIAVQKKLELDDINAKEAENIKAAQEDKKGAAVITKIRQSAAAERRAAEAKSNSDILALDRESNKQRVAMQDQHNEEVKKKAEETAAQELAHKTSQHETDLQNLSNNFDSEIARLDEAYAKKKSHTQKEERDHNNKKLDLQEEYQIKALQSDIEFTKETLAIAEARAKASGKQEDIYAVASAKGKLANLEIKLTDLVAQHQIDKNKRVGESDEAIFQKRMERLEKLAGYSKQVADIIGGFIENSVNKQTQALDEQQQQFDKNYEKEVSNITNSTLTEEQKAARLKVLESEKFAHTEQIERKKKSLEVEKAKFDKAANIASIITETVLAVMRALGDKTVPFPIRVGYAIAAGAIGAANLAKAIATPLPKFKDGTQSSPEGPALTDEEGPELYVKPSGEMFMGNDQPTIRYLDRGTKIIPYDEVNQYLLNCMMKQTVYSIPDKTSSEISKMRAENRDNMVWLAGQLKDAMKSKQPINININDFKNSDYIRAAVRE
jgi:hypothetical protein